MRITYILTTILMITLYLLMYKKEEKKNLINEIIISFVLILASNIIVCTILSFIEIKTTLVSLSVINIILSLIFGYKIKKDKKMQKYFINIIDILAIILIILIGITVTLIRFGPTIEIKYRVTDAETHFYAANDFYTFSKLLQEKNTDTLGMFNLKAIAPGAYINTGIFFKILDKLVTRTYFCKLYFIFDISMWILSGFLMYVLLSNNKKENKTKIIPLILSLVYMLGYPLYSLLCGYSYLTVGLNFIIGILIVMQANLTKQHKWTLLFILNFGLMFTYYYFAPIIFLAEFWQIIRDTIKQNKKLFTVDSICSTLITLIIPGIFGIFYYVILQIIRPRFDGVSDYATILATPGPIYDNLITNMLIFLIIDIYYIIYTIKHKQDDICLKFLILNIIISIGLFIGMKLNVVSQYYYFKVYYCLWIFVICVAEKGLSQIISKSKKNMIITYICTGIYVVGVIVGIVFEKNLIFFDIFRNNCEEIKRDFVIVTDEELEILDYYNENINHYQIQDNALISAVTLNESRWIYGITRNGYFYIQYYIEDVNIQEFLNEEYNYFILMRRYYCDDYDKVDEEIEANNLKILFKNDDGMILQKQ